MASVPELFQRRPLRLARDPDRQRRRLGLLAFALILGLPAAYWGWHSVRSAMLQEGERRVVLAAAGRA